jgi:ankyrin repeat protein
MLNSKTWDLHNACNDCDINSIIQILDEGVNVNSKNNHGMTPLHSVSYFKGNDKQICLDVIKLLIERGANIEEKDEINNTPLHIACWEGNITMAIELINIGANINARNIGGLTPLHYASNEDYKINIVQRLIEEGVNINEKNNDNETALSMVCQRKIINKFFSSTTKIIELLLDNGTDINNIDMNNVWSLHRNKCIHLFEKEKHKRSKRKILYMRSTFNHWKKIQDRKSIQAGYFTVSNIM